MPVTKKQQNAARAEYGRRRRGLKPQKFQDMSMAELREWSKAPLHKKKKK